MMLQTSKDLVQPFAFSDEEVSSYILCSLKHSGLVGVNKLIGIVPWEVICVGHFLCLI